MRLVLVTLRSGVSQNNDSWVVTYKWLNLRICEEIINLGNIEV